MRYSMIVQFIQRLQYLSEDGKTSAIVVYLKQDEKLE